MRLNRRRAAGPPLMSVQSVPLWVQTGCCCGRRTRPAEALPIEPRIEGEQASKRSSGSAVVEAAAWAKPTGRSRGPFFWWGMEGGREPAQIIRTPAENNSVRVKAPATRK